MSMEQVRNQISTEIMRQNAKWGDQSALLDGTGPDEVFIDRGKDHGAWVFAEDTEWTFEQMRDHFKAATKLAAAAGECTWRHILLEEVFEALAEESNSQELADELTQVGAVTMQWKLALLKGEGGRKPVLEWAVSPDGKTWSEAGAETHARAAFRNLVDSQQPGVLGFRLQGSGATFTMQDFAHICEAVANGKEPCDDAFPNSVWPECPIHGYM